MIVSLGELKRYLNVASGVTTNDTLYDSFIHEATVFINNYLRYNVESGSRTIEFMISDTLDSGSSYIINDKNVTAITTLKGKSNVLDSWVTVSSDNYTYYTTNHLTYLHNNAGFSKINQLVYTAGYTTIPDAIKAVCIEYCFMKIRESGIGKNILGISQVAENHNGISQTTQFKDLTAKWYGMLQPYRVHYI